jgi:hypothetical protein
VGDADKGDAFVDVRQRQVADVAVACAHEQASLIPLCALPSHRECLSLTQAPPSVHAC